MVTDKVCNSAAESTLPLFKELKDQLVLMCGQMEKRNKRWRIGKMLSSSTFRRDFERAKTSVLELKTALRDFLDQEQQDAQDKQLSSISETNLALNEKLATQSDQLKARRARSLSRRRGATRTAERPRPHPPLPKTNRRFRTCWRSRRRRRRQRPKRRRRPRLRKRRPNF